MATNLGQVENDGMIMRVTEDPEQKIVRIVFQSTQTDQQHIWTLQKLPSTFTTALRAVSQLGRQIAVFGLTFPDKYYLGMVRYLADSSQIRLAATAFRDKSLREKLAEEFFFQLTFDQAEALLELLGQ